MKFTDNDIDKIAHDLALLALQRRVPNADRVTTDTSRIRDLDCYMQDEILVKNYFAHFESIKAAIKNYNH